jgi:hypothetical protein
MNKVFIRHAKPQAYSKIMPNPNLHTIGRSQSRQLGGTLASLGYNLSTPVAASQLNSAVQTAHFAGFTTINQYAILNEYPIEDNKIEFLKSIKNQSIPKPLLQYAQAILNNPPPEQIIFTHALVIAAISRLADLILPRPRPSYTQITKISIWLIFLHQLCKFFSNYCSVVPGNFFALNYHALVATFSCN